MHPDKEIFTSCAENAHLCYSVYSVLLFFISFPCATRYLTVSHQNFQINGIYKNKIK